MKRNNTKTSQRSPQKQHAVAIVPALSTEARLQVIYKNKDKSKESNRAIKLIIGDETFVFYKGKTVEYDRHVPLEPEEWQEFNYGRH